jgi:cytochrome P450
MAVEPLVSSPAEVDFDHTDREFMQNPYEMFGTLRERHPVARSTKFDGFWVLSRYDDLIAAARDPQTFSSAAGVTIPDFGSPVPMVPIEADPPMHQAFRKLLQREFTRSRMAAFEEAIATLADELIDKFAGSGAADLAPELCSPLPSIVIAQLLGFPAEDWNLFRGYTEQLLETAKSGDLEANIGAALEFCTYLANALDDRRREPRDDMLTRVVEARIGDRLITEDEALGLTLLTVVAGHETTVGGISSLLLHVARTPGLKDRLIAEPELIPKAVEEALRVEAPIQGIARTLTKDVNLHGRQMREGDKVWLLWAAGNRDPAQFPEPESFDIDRKSNRHLGFGDGIHRCVGAPLAQLEMRIVLEKILQRIPGYRVDDPAGVVFSGGQNRMVSSLPVVWDPAKNS